MTGASVGAESDGSEERQRGGGECHQQKSKERCELRERGIRSPKRSCRDGADECEILARHRTC